MSTQTSIINILNSTLQKHIEEEKEVLIAEATESFNKRIRKLVAQTAMAIQDLYTIETNGQYLTITVKIKQEKLESNQIST